MAKSKFPSVISREAVGTEAIDKWFPTWKCLFFFATLHRFLFCLCLQNKYWNNQKHLLFCWSCKCLERPRCPEDPECEPYESAACCCPREISFSLWQKEEEQSKDVKEEKSKGTVKFICPVLQLVLCSCAHAQEPLHSGKPYNAQEGTWAVLWVHMALKETFQQYFLS